MEPHEPVVATVPEPRTVPLDLQLRRKGFFAAGGVLLLIASFAVGMFINRDGAPKNAPEPVLEESQRESAVTPAKRADTPLVPTGERGGFGQPITSAPTAAATDGLSSEYQRSDATAVSSVEYQQLAQRAAAEKSRERMAALVDPRTITGAAYAQGSPIPARPRPRAESAAAPVAPPPATEVPAEPRRISIRTRPVPQYQPVPPLRAHGVARLDLLIGADGRVKEVTIRRAIEGNTAALVNAVQGWRFKPATENGEPVAAPFSVEISFNGNG